MYDVILVEILKYKRRPDHQSAGKVHKHTLKKQAGTQISNPYLHSFQHLIKVQLGYIFRKLAFGFDSFQKLATSHSEREEDTSGQGCRQEKTSARM